MNISVSLDTTRFEKWARDLGAKQLHNALRRALDQSARYARKATIPIIAADIGVAPAKVKPATPKIIASTQTSLAARWTVSKLRIGILNTNNAVISKSGLTASTHTLGGGRSKALSAKNAFLVKTANGGTFVAIRRGKERLPLKGIYAENPATALGQDGAPAQKTWRTIASSELARRIPFEVQKALNGQNVNPETPDIGD